MRYIFCAESDKGIRKPINQDAVVVKEGVYHKTPILMAAVCDGMGGLEHGEKASSMLVDMLDQWFEKELPKLISFTKERGLRLDRTMKYSLKTVIREANKKIREFGQERDIKCGTTVTVLVLYEDRYYILNVGDSRIYVFRNHLYQLTSDQTVVQRLIDLGELDEVSAEKHPERSKLLQCVGVQEKVSPVFSNGEAFANDIYLLCSDGLRHKIRKREMEDVFRTERPRSCEQLSDMCSYFVSENMRRQETDNLSCVLVRTRR